MQLSHNGLESIKDLEGFSANAYLDTGGVWTIGYGTIRYNDLPVQPGQHITLQEAELALQSDTAWAQTAVNKLVRVPLTQNQFDALVSFVYNIGENQFLKSTMLRKLNSGDYSGAAKEFERWTFDNGKTIPGLVKRRKIERSKFES